MSRTTAPRVQPRSQSRPQGLQSSGNPGYNGASSVDNGAHGAHAGLSARPSGDLNAHGAAGQKRPGLPPKGAMEHPTQVKVLPPAGREEQLERWGISPDRLGDHLFTGDRRGHGPDDAVDVAGAGDDGEDRELEERGFLLDGGWHAVTVTEGGGRSGGMTSHRSVTHQDEYVDPDTFRALIERELGFSYEQVRSVYRQGPLTADQRELRGSIDARLLALSRAGGNMAELGRALGFKTTGDTMHRALKNALARARQEES